MLIDGSRCLVLSLLSWMQIQGFKPSTVSRRSQHKEQRRRSNFALQVSSTVARNESFSSDFQPVSLPLLRPPEPIDSSGATARTSFEDGEHTPILSSPTQTEGINSSTSRTSNSVEVITSTADLAAFMLGDHQYGGSGDDEELTVIKYYANYCKICQRAGIQLKKVASEYPNVRFAKVESMVFPESAQTLRSLGVTKFPFVQIYRKGQCVASFSTGPSHLFVKKVRDTINICLSRSLEEWDAFVSEFSNEIHANRQARDTVLPGP